MDSRPSTGQNGTARLSRAPARIVRALLRRPARLLRRIARVLLLQITSLTEGISAPPITTDYRLDTTRLGRRLRRLNLMQRVREVLATAAYRKWLDAHFPLNDVVRARMRSKIAEFQHKPLISIILPVYNPHPQHLSQAIDTAIGQLYPHIEICIADDASTDPRVRPLLERYQAQDSRVKLCFRNSNGHISEATNSAIELASGEYLAFLDHDDLLAEDALFWMVDAINAAPDARLFYSDEDKLSGSGRRCKPYFKCDWNPVLFMGQNMICHLAVYDAALVRELGGLRKGYEGAQDFDLAARAAARLTAGQIVHIPRVLYHWRVSETSTATNVSIKPYAIRAAEGAVDNFLREMGLDGRAECHVATGINRVSLSLPTPAPHVTIIIPTRNQCGLLRTCIWSIRTVSTYPAYDILVVDNGSDDPETLAYLRELEQTEQASVLPQPGAFNFSAINNAAVQQARGTVVTLLNNDIEVVAPDWLEQMVQWAVVDWVGAVGAKLRYPDGTIQHGGVVLGLGGVAGHSHKLAPADDPGYARRLEQVQCYSAVTAACLVVEKAKYLRVGGLDEVKLAVAFNDVDFCLKLREAGYWNVWTPHAELIHHESKSRGYEDSPEKIHRFAGEIRYMEEKWESWIQHDPAYNPNLTLDHEDFSIAWPPRVSWV